MRPKKKPKDNLAKIDAEIALLRAEQEFLSSKWEWYQGKISELLAKKGIVLRTKENNRDIDLSMFAGNDY